MIRLIEENKVIKKFKPFILGFCACNCGTQIGIRKSDGRLRRFANNHYTRSRDQKGSNNVMWKGYAFNHEYLMTKAYDHPFRNKENYVLTHRLIFEHYLKIMFDEDVYIPRNVDIHHKNKNRQDNSLINLESIYHNDHNKKDHSKTICLLCGSNKTFMKHKKYPEWRKYENGFICIRCFQIQKRRERRTDLKK